MTVKDRNGDRDGEPFALEAAGEYAVQTLFAIVHNRFSELEHSEHLSQQKLATRMALTRSQISRWFTNPSNMTLRSAAKLLAAMGRKLEFAAADPLALSASSSRSGVILSGDARYDADEAASKSSGAGHLHLVQGVDTMEKRAEAPRPPRASLAKPEFDHRIVLERAARVRAPTARVRGGRAFANSPKPAHSFKIGDTPATIVQVGQPCRFLLEAQAPNDAIGFVEGDRIWRIKPDTEYVGFHSITDLVSQSNLRRTDVDAFEMQGTWIF